MRGPLFRDGYKPQFSGHETFPLRYGWLKKAFDAVRAAEVSPEAEPIFGSEKAIAHFGVGKNMVAAIRHWAIAAGVIAEEAGRLRTTELGRMIFADDGLDPFMENPATLWLVHWHLSGRPAKTTWYWAFNHHLAATFERDNLIKELQELARERNWSRVAAATVKRDVECFVRTYAARPGGKKATLEDELESPLTELGLIKALGKRDGFRFARGPKDSLAEGVFTYALLDFWSRASKARTLSFEALAYEPGSPGRVFLLNEDDLASRLVELDETTGGALRWSETAGLKQVIRDSDIAEDEALAFIGLDYQSAAEREAA